MGPKSEKKKKKEGEDSKTGAEGDKDKKKDKKDKPKKKKKEKGKDKDKDAGASAKDDAKKQKEKDAKDTGGKKDDPKNEEVKDTGGKKDDPKNEEVKGEDKGDKGAKKEAGETSEPAKAGWFKMPDFLTSVKEAISKSESQESFDMHDEKAKKGEELDADIKALFDNVAYSIHRSEGCVIAPRPLWSAPLQRLMVLLLNEDGFLEQTTVAPPLKTLDKSTATSILTQFSAMPLEQVHHFAYNGEYMNALFKDRKLVDILVHVENRTFYGHQCVLCAHSGYFSSVLIDSSIPPYAITDFTLKSIDPEDFKAFLNFAYSGDILITLSSVERLRKLANKLKSKTLRAKIALFLSKEKQLTLEEALARILNMSEGDDYTRPLAMETVVKNFKRLLLDPSQLCLFTADDLLYILQADNLLVDSELDAFWAVLYWVAIDAPNRATDLNKLMTAVRFTTMSSLELMDCARVSELVRLSKKCQALLINANWVCHVREVGLEDPLGLNKEQRRSSLSQMPPHEPTVAEFDMRFLIYNALLQNREGPLVIPKADGPGYGDLYKDFGTINLPSRQEIVGRKVKFAPTVVNSPGGVATPDKAKSETAIVAEKEEDKPAEEESKKDAKKGVAKKKKGKKGKKAGASSSDEGPSKTEDTTKNNNPGVTFIEGKTTEAISGDNTSNNITGSLIALPPASATNTAVDDREYNHGGSRNPKMTTAEPQDHGDANRSSSVGVFSDSSASEQGVAPVRIVGDNHHEWVSSSVGCFSDSPLKMERVKTDSEQVDPLQLWEKATPSAAELLLLGGNILQPRRSLAPSLARSKREPGGGASGIEGGVNGADCTVSRAHDLGDLSLDGSLTSFSTSLAVWRQNTYGNTATSAASPLDQDTVLQSVGANDSTSFGIDKSLAQQNFIDRNPLNSFGSESPGSPDKLVFKKIQETVFCDYESSLGDVSASFEREGSSLDQVDKPGTIFDQPRDTEVNSSGSPIERQARQSRQYSVKDESQIVWSYEPEDDFNETEYFMKSVEERREHYGSDTMPMIVSSHGSHLSEMERSSLEMEQPILSPSRGNATRSLHTGSEQADSDLIDFNWDD